MDSKHQTAEAVLQPACIEIDQIAQTHLREPKISQYLSGMDRRQGVYRFHLDNHLAVHKQVQTKPRVEPLTPIAHGDGDLTFHRQTRPHQVSCEAMLIDGFEQTRSE